MVDFTKWDSFKNKTILQENRKLLKEFSNKEKKDILENGSDFTISYEIEMESEDEIDEDGILKISGSSRPDIDGMESWEQIDFFDYNERLKEIAGEEEIGEIIDEWVDTTNLNEEIVSSLSCVIASYGETLLPEDESYPVELHDSDIETFILASFLSSGRGAFYKKELLKITSNKHKYRELINNVEKLGVEVSSSHYLFDSEREVFVWKILGFSYGGSGEEKIEFIKNTSLSPKNIFKAIFSLEDDSWFNDEKTILTNACNFLFSREPSLSSVEHPTSLTKKIYKLVNGVDSVVPNNYRAIESFDEFKIGMQKAAERAQALTDTYYQKLSRDFNYRHYDLDPNDYLDLDNYNSGDGTESSLEKYLPNFWGKYGGNMSATDDASLRADHNIEIAMNSYLYGVEAAMEHLEIFFNDFETQDNFTFSHRTGLHTNISLNMSNKRFNLIKLLFALSEREPIKIDGKLGVPFAYKGIESRFENDKWSSPIKDDLLNSIRNKAKTNPELLAELKRLYDVGNLNEIVSKINRLIFDEVSQSSVKNHGLNLHYIKSRGYIEFRYPGHNVDKDALKNLTLYYCYVVKNALDHNFNEKNYNKKLIGFLQELFASVEQSNGIPYKQVIEEYKDFIKGYNPEGLANTFTKLCLTHYFADQNIFSIDAKNDIRRLKITLNDIIRINPQINNEIGAWMQTLPKAFSLLFKKIYTTPDKIALIFYFLTWITSSYSFANMAAIELRELFTGHFRTTIFKKEQEPENLT